MKLVDKAFLLATSIVVTSCGSKDRVPEAKRPNILFVIADDVSYPHKSAYGCPWVKTPAFDRVASEGLLFNNAYTSNAKSAPSRACILTGQYSWELEEIANHVSIWPENKFPTIFETLAESGYYTAFTGKGWAPGNPGMKNGAIRELIGVPYQDKQLDPPTKHISKTDYAGNFSMFLSNKPKNKPWAFWYGAHEPHRRYEYGSGALLGNKSIDDIDKVPFFWPDNKVVRNDMLDYAFEIEHFDRHLGHMLEMLVESGELSNTIIIVTADNGMPFPRSKGFSYSYSNHLPLAVMWPDGIVDPGREVNDYVNFVDFTPTLLQIANVEKHQMNPSGKDLTDIFNNQPTKDRSYTILGQERHDYGRPENKGYPIRSIIQDGYLYIFNFKPELWPAGNPETGYLNTDGSPTKTEILNLRRDERDTHLWEMSFGKRQQEELYHILTDRECLINLAENSDYNDIKSKLKEKLFEELRNYNDPRVMGGGDQFDRYPFHNKSAHNYYERYMRGEITEYQTHWVDSTDYEVEIID